MTLADFTSQFSFTINTRNVTVYGNGFAFFLAPVGYQIPPNSAGGYLGLLNSSTMAGSFPTQVVSVEFDSYFNEDWDPTQGFTPYVGSNSGKKGITCWSWWNRMRGSSRVVDGNGPTTGAHEVGTHLDGGGELDDHSVVVVKRIFAESESLFINELNVISRLKHRNLVRFTDYCHEQNQPLLVYEYMSNGYLDNHLHGYKPTLSWHTRQKIAIELASALNDLHEDTEQCVIHRDIKSDNVLLDLDFTTKLSDFGVSKLVEREQWTETTMIIGTYGYLAPEYEGEGKSRKETNMYSFGIVALEIRCGRKPNRRGTLIRLVWQLYLACCVIDAADARLENFDQNGMRCLMTVGLWCTNPNDRERPDYRY
ncbi:hypothetical protein GQ457_12G012630 [Hibiscus cannabinus]